MKRLFITSILLTVSFCLISAFAGQNGSASTTGSSATGLLPATNDHATMLYENLSETEPNKTSVAARTARINPLADPNKIKATLKKFQGLENELEQLERKADSEARQWLQQRTDNRLNLAKEVHDQITAELFLLRKLAAEEKAEKTTAAIDALLLNRKNRLDKLIEKLQGDLRQLRSTRTRATTRYQDRYIRGQTQQDYLTQQGQDPNQQTPARPRPQRR